MDSSQIASILLDRAGLCKGVRSINPIKEVGFTNQMSLVELQDGSQYILREYKWPHKSADLDRLRKEKFLHKLLREHGVLVSEILAEFQDQDSAALLMQYLPGELLGDIATRFLATECAQAWYSAGEVLRQAHSITYPAGTQGIIVGEEIQPLGGGSWGHFHLYNALDHAEKLLEMNHDIKLNIKEFGKILESAVPILNRTSPTLLHNDAHPWNVLVQFTPKGWACSGWLDWEYAWVGDPIWDLVRMDIFRFKPIGPTPPSFYEGYGAFPAEPNRSIYELSIYLWMANQYLNGDRSLMPTYEAAMKYLDRIDVSVKNLGQLIRQEETKAKI